MAEDSVSDSKFDTSDLVLGILFTALVLGSAAALAYDFRSLLGEQQAFETGSPFGNPGRVVTGHGAMALN